MCVKFIKKNLCYIEKSVKIGNNVVIHPFNVILGNSVIEDNVVLKQGNYIENSKVGSGSVVENSHMCFAEIGQNCSVGPFARLRVGTIIGDSVKIGNFVEIKNSVIAKGTKAGHLAYIGDVDIGENCNIGCGAIFVNYNGKNKNRSKVGNNCFIGSNVNVIAPVEISDFSYICAGSTLTVNTEPEDFVIARTRETIKKKRAKNYLKGE